MATFGNTSPTGALWTNAENVIQAGRFSSGGAGNLQSITAYLREGTTSNAHTVKCLLYLDSDDSFIAETSARSDILTTAGWYTFSFVSPPAITNQNYLICVWSNAGVGNLEILYDNTAGSAEEDAATYGTAPDPATWDGTTKTRDVSIYGTYTVSGGGILLRRNPLQGIIQR